MPFYPPSPRPHPPPPPPPHTHTTKSPKNQNLKKRKNEKLLEILSVYSVLQMMVLEAWFLRYGLWQTKVFVILGHSLPFYSTNNLKNQYFEKVKKTLRDTIILHLCTTNDNHVMYGSWHMECNEYNFMSFWAIFCPFTIPFPLPSLTTRKIKILKKWEKCLEILSFYICVP